MWKQKIEIPDVEKNNIKKTIAIKKAIGNSTSMKTTVRRIKVTIKSWEQLQREKKITSMNFQKMKIQKIKFPTILKYDIIFKLLRYPINQTQLLLNNLLGRKVKW